MHYCYKALLVSKGEGNGFRQHSQKLHNSNGSCIYDTSATIIIIIIINEGDIGMAGSTKQGAYIAKIHKVT